MKPTIPAVAGGQIMTILNDTVSQQGQLSLSSSRDRLMSSKLHQLVL